MKRNNYLRICAIVLMGVLIPYLSGLIHPSLYYPAGLIFSIIFFITLAFLLTSGARLIHHRMRYLPWLRQRLLHKISAIVAVVSLFSVFVGSVLLYIWSELAWQRMSGAAVMQFLANTVLAVIIISLIEEMFLMNDEKRTIGRLPSAAVDTIPLTGAILQHTLASNTAMGVNEQLTTGIAATDTLLSEKVDIVQHGSITHRRKSRLLLRKGLENIPVRLDELALFYTENKMVYALDHSGKRYMADKKLTELEAELDPSMFFRANRQYIIGLNFIKGFKPYDKVKLQVDLTVSEGNHQVIISQETAPAFRKWMNEA